MADEVRQAPAQKQKVLFIITKSNWGGAQRYVYDIATHLPRDMEPLVVYGPSRNGAAENLSTMLAAAAIRTIVVPELTRDIGFSADVRAFRRLFSIIKKEEPAIVHLNSSKAGGIGALAARIAGVKRIIFTSHGLSYDEDRRLVSRWLIFLATWATFALSHVVICISEDTARRAARLWGMKHTVHFIRNGIAPFETLSRNEARACLRMLNPSIPHHALWIGTIAELTHNKGLTYLIDACALVKKQIPDFACVIIGGGEERAALQERIAQQNSAEHVFLVGFVAHAHRYLKAFDLFTLTSVKEGLPYVLLEAGQAGIPVVASDISGVRDIIEDHKTGILTPPKDPHALAEALCGATRDERLRRALASALHEHVTTRFSLNTMLDQTIALYRSRPASR